MRLFLFLVAIGLTILPAGAIAASRHSASKRTQQKSRVSHRRTRVRSTSKHTRRRRHSRRSRRTRVRRYQLHPTAARYRQIQQALASKGYYHGELDGKWGPESIAALQQFQTEQGIDNQGKITALALIGLGLGPKHKHATIPMESTETARSLDDSDASGRGQEESESKFSQPVMANQ